MAPKKVSEGFRSLAVDVQHFQSGQAGGKHNTGSLTLFLLIQTKANRTTKDLEKREKELDKREKALAAREAKLATEGRGTGRISVSLTIERSTQYGKLAS